MTDADLLNALRDCFVPGTRRNLVSAAMVRSATLRPDPDAPGAGIPGVPPRYVAQVTLVAPATEDASEQMRAQVLNRLAGLQWISRTELQIQPPLFPILMS